jgi:hypothetical protein
MRSKILFAALALTLATTASFAQSPAQRQNAQLPLTFEVNQGPVRFLSHGSGYTAFLTSNCIVLTRATRRPGIENASSSSSSNLTSNWYRRVAATGGTPNSDGRVTKRTVRATCTPVL